MLNQSLGTARGARLSLVQLNAVIERLAPQAFGAFIFTNAPRRSRSTSSAGRSSSPDLVRPGRSLPAVAGVDRDGSSML